MSDESFVLKSFLSSIEDLKEHIRRRTNYTEDSLIYISIILSISVYRAGTDKRSSSVARACAIALFKGITLDFDESSNSISQVYRKRLGYSQEVLDEQVVKALDKVSNDPCYDSSTIRAVIIGTRSFLDKLEIDKLKEVLEENFDPTMEMVVSLLKKVAEAHFYDDKPIIAESHALLSRYLKDKNSSLHALLYVS
jgi:hypothetical protein